MPLLKKLIHMGKTSHAVSIPKEWIDYWERDGGKVEWVEMEINGDITIRPYWKNEALEPVTQKAS